MVSLPRDLSGSMPELVRSHDWAKTLVGPIDRWPLSLRRYVDLILEMPTPAIIFWGPEKVQLYNDGYAVIMGPRHPKYLGATYRECWPDTCPTINPWMDRLLATGEVVEVKDTLFTLTRHGYSEEAYFTFTFSPLRDDDGKIAGIYQPVIEVTANVLGGRRTQTLWQLSSIRGKTPALDAAMTALSDNPKDIPFAIACVRNAESGALECRASTGLSSGSASLSDAGLSLMQRHFAEDAPKEETEGEPQEELPVSALLDQPHLGFWGDATLNAVVIPFDRSNPTGSARGLCVIGLSPRLRFDEAYRQFLQSVVRSLCANLGAEQELRLHVEREQLLAVREQAIRARDEFLSIASHELKTPLTPLTIRLQALAREARLEAPSPFANRVVQQLEVGQRQMKKMSELIGDLLDVSRLGTGGLVMEPESVDFAAVLRDVVSGFAAEAERTGTPLELLAPDQFTLIADRLRLEQVISNLLSNALKYGPGEPIEIRLAEVGDRVQLSVKDGGIGIKSENLERIFEKFERGVSAHHYGGLGLGLYVAREIVHALGGTIVAESTVGEGSRFTVELPRTRPSG